MTKALTARGAAAKMIEAIRLTGQATPRNKVGFYLDYQNVCNGSAYAKGAEQCRDRGDDWVAIGSVGAGFFGALAPEAGNVWDNREKITQFTWTSPFTNKLLLEAGFSQFASRFGGQIPGGALTNFIPVQEQSTLGGVPVGNFTYRGWSSAGSNEQFHNVWRASGDLRHRRTQHEGRVSGGVPGAEELPERGQPVELRLQQPQRRFSSRCGTRRSGRATARASTRSTCRISGRAAG